MEPRTVLLVEDDAQDERLALRALRGVTAGSRVDVVRDGAEACDYLLRSGAYAGWSTRPLPAVILLDIKLPKLSGLDVLARLRQWKATRTIPVVMLTSSDDERDVVTSYELGANSYVRKPVEADAFSRAVRQLGLYWLDVNELPQI